MRITSNDVILSNGQSVTELLSNLDTPMTLVLSVKGGKARLGLPDEYYNSSDDRAATAHRIADGLVSFGQTIKTISDACPEDAGLLSPRTYRNVQEAVQVNGQSVMVKSQKSTFAIWFNPDAETRTSTGTTGPTISDQVAAITNELMELNPSFDFGSLHSTEAVALGQLRHALRAAKAQQITETADQVDAQSEETPEVTDESAESVVEGI